MTRRNKKIPIGILSVLMAAAMFLTCGPVSAFAQRDGILLSAGTSGEGSAAWQPIPDGEGAMQEAMPEGKEDRPAAFLEEGDIVHISGAEGFLALAEKCRYDAWSEGKKVLLDCDITLDPDSSRPIPSFSGIFDGQGHTISGFILNGEAAYTGVFGTVGERGVIRDLGINGTIQPSGIQTRLGGIAGTNHGLIENCSFNGIVNAHSQTGGIAGRNMQTGEIRDCLAYGSVQGDTYTGGIAGYNEGTIRSCTNRALVNTVYTDVPYTTDKLSNTLENILLTGKLTSSENIDARIDSGGIAGLSSGMIASCVNEGDVGYEHVGYNTGGIVGRSSGFVKDCRNEGTILGRKDVGGIAGQLQPFLQLDFSDTLLGDLDEELDTLDGLLKSSLDKAGSYSADANRRLRAMLDLADTARSSVKTLTNEAGNTVDRAVSSANEASGALRRSIDAMSDVAGSVTDYLQRVKEKLSALDGRMEALLSDTRIPQEERDKLREAYREFREGSELLTEAEERLKKLPEEQPDPDQIPAILEEIYRDVQSGYTMMKESSQKIREILGSETFPVDVADMDIETLRETFSSLLKEASETPEIGGGIEDVLDELAGVEIHFSGISDAARQAGNSLYDSLGGMLSQMNGLNESIGAETTEAIDDLKKITDQIRTIFDTIQEVAEDQMHTDEDVGERIQDVSAENIGSATQGRTTGCRNEGTVDADSNVGGIVGTIGIEYDFDPEQDIQQFGDSSLDYIFRARGIVDASENHGSIKCRNNYCGGIAGNMEMGVVAGCTDTGDVTSTGNYVGGIAGYSAAGIQDCCVRADISGGRYVGGIAGLGTRIHRSAAMFNIVDAKQFSGAVAGWIREVSADKVSENVFYSDTAYGIDGVGYRGMAEENTYAQLAGREGTGLVFSSLTLRFVADDETVETLSCGYGDEIAPDRIPAVPEKDGFFGKWSREDFSRITHDETVRAQYDRIVTLLAAPETRENGLAVLLAEGKFAEGEKLEAVKDISAQHVKERWNVTVPEQPGAEEGGAITLRFLPPEDCRDPEIWIIRNGTQEKADVSENGKYLTFAIPQRSATFELREAAHHLRIFGNRKQ
ncbi:MAG: hypothetical protein J6I56_05545 [Lachnospiraceae bacterium]|nr:hypothetical protein [Lachnospiraceae bacterium]